MFVNKLFKFLISVLLFLNNYDTTPNEEVTAMEKAQKLMELMPYFLIFMWVYRDTFDAYDALSSLVSKYNLQERFLLNSYKEQDGSEMNCRTVIHKFIKSAYPNIRDEFRVSARKSLQKVSNNEIPVEDLEEFIRRTVSYHQSWSIIEEILQKEKLCL